MNEVIFDDSRLFDYSTTVVYVENAYNSEINLAIQSDFNKLSDIFKSENIGFIYLPYLFNNADYQELLSYNRPYLSTPVYEQLTLEIYKGLKNQLTNPFKGPGLICISKKDTISEVLSGYRLQDDELLVNQFDFFAKSIDKKKIWRNAHTLYFQLEIPDETEPEPSFFEKIKSRKKGKNKNAVESNVSFQEVGAYDADSQFESEAFKLTEEIKERILKLKESGSLNLLAQVLEEVLNVKPSISRIFITSDYRIYLKDYDMKEVTMPPLPKALFLLFLRHPNGIKFKYLSDYHDELLSIYRNVTFHEDIIKAMESIKAMTDPMNNSVNEKCSRIREAFLKVISDDLAQNYYVIGKRGEPKKIILDRKYVTFQK